MAKDTIEDQTNKVLAKKEIEPDLLDRVTDFFSRERGLERSEKLEDAIRYYLGPYAGSLGQANQLLNPVVGLQDAGEATREGRYVDAVTDTAAAALPIAGALAAKPLAKSVQSGIDEAVDAVTEVMTGGTFDKGRREVLGTMVAAPVAVAAGSTGIVDELIAPLAKKVAGSGSLSGSLAKLKSLDSKRTDLSIKMNKLLGDQSPYSYGVTSRIPPKNLIELEDTDKILSSTIKETNKEFFENTLNLITETNLKKLSKEELEELSDKMFDGINSDLDGNNFEQIKGLTEKFNDKNILMAKEYERLGLDNNTYYNHLEMIDDELANFDDLPQGVKDAINNNEDRAVRVPLFNKGGTAMKDQIEMNFGEAETVDPVSGNDVPPGSLPEEVRDDIPARLSEGEYVVPADVVRYYGVKFFEDLRTQAKMGLQQMDADGRIGGEPIEPQQAELSDDDLNSIIEQAMQQEQPMMANEGGVVGYYSGGGNFDYLGGSIFGPQKKATDTTVANQFYDPDVGGYKPTTGSYDPDPQAAPVVAAARVADPVCPTGFRYDRNQGRCVPKSEGPDVVNQTINTGEIKFGKDFGKSVDWNDATAVQEFALGTPGDSTKSGLNTPFKPFGLDKKSQNQLAGAALLVGGVNPVSLLAGAATRIYQNVDATKDLAGLRASEIIAYAKGHNEVGGKINKAIGQYVEQAGKGYSNKSGLLKNIVGTGYNYASEVLGVKKEDLKNFMSVVDNANSTETEVAEAQKALQEKMTQTKKLVAQSRERADQREQEKITAAQQAVLKAQETPIQSGRLEKMLGVSSQGRPARDSEGNDLSDLDPTKLNWEQVRQLRSYDSAANRQKLAEWEAASGKEGSKGAQAGSGGCFLTTAIVEHRGEADDGPTLTKLRNFRDTYLADYPEEVKKYYQVAPKIVAAIPKDNPTWDWVGKQIDSAIEHIDNNMLDKAHETYKSMVLELETNWLKKA